MRLAGFNIFKLLRYLREELMVVFATTSSDSVLPQIMSKLKRMGIRDSTVGLVIPTGYSFNLDAFSIYITLAAVFIAQATNTPITMTDLLTILAISLVTSKGAHGVPGSAIVVLAATLAGHPGDPGDRPGAGAVGRLVHGHRPRAGQPDRQLRRHRRGRRLGRRHRPRARACGARRPPVPPTEDDADVIIAPVPCRRAPERSGRLQSLVMASQTEIAQRVVESILAQKLAPGERLGEQELADLFGVSRTLVREALMQLQARGFVEVRTRKGWYVVEPSFEQARDAFAARRVDRDRHAAREPKAAPLQSVIKRLRQHVADERDAIDGADAATRAFLLADFHVCLADCLGNRLLADMLRDLTARTTLVATLYQSTHDAAESVRRPRPIVGALEAGDIARAER